MPAFVRYNPNTDAEETLENGIKRPQSQAEIPRRDCRTCDVGIEDIESSD